MSVHSLMSQTDVDQTDERMREEGGNEMELRLFRVAVSKDDDDDDDWGTFSLTAAIHQGDICKREKSFLASSLINSDCHASQSVLPPIWRCSESVKGFLVPRSSGRSVVMRQPSIRPTLCPTFTTGVQNIVILFSNA